MQGVDPAVQRAVQARPQRHHRAPNAQQLAPPLALPLRARHRLRTPHAERNTDLGQRATTAGGFLFGVPLTQPQGGDGTNFLKRPKHRLPKNCSFTQSHLVGRPMVGNSSGKQLPDMLNLQGDTNMCLPISLRSQAANKNSLL